MTRTITVVTPRQHCRRNILLALCIATFLRFRSHNLFAFFPIQDSLFSDHPVHPSSEKKRVPDIGFRPDIPAAHQNGWRLAGFGSGGSKVGENFSHSFVEIPALCDKHLGSGFDDTTETLQQSISLGAVDWSQCVVNGSACAAIADEPNPIYSD